MGKNHHDNFLGKTHCRSFRELVVSVVRVSWWYFGGVSVVS